MGFFTNFVVFFNRVSVEFVFCTIFVIVKIYVCGLGVLQDLECCASQEPGATALFRMVPHVLVNSIQEVPGQGDVEFLGFSEVFGHIDIDDCPDTARELRVARVMGNGSRYRNDRAVLGEQFQMAFDGFSCHGHGVIQVFAGRETAGNIWHLDTPGVGFVTLENRDWIVHERPRWPLEIWQGRLSVVSE